MATKKVGQQILLLVLDPGSGIRDGKKSGSGINIPVPQHWIYRSDIINFLPTVI